MASNINTDFDATLPADTTGVYAGKVTKTTFVNTLGDLKTGLETAKEEITGLQDGKQDALESGQNIKQINGQSILGSGNLIISAGGADIPDWQASTAYEAGEEFTFRTTNTTAVDIDGTAIPANKTMIGAYRVAKTSSATLTNVEMALIELRGGAGGVQLGSLSTPSTLEAASTQDVVDTLENFGGDKLAPTTPIKLHELSSPTNFNMVNGTASFNNGVATIKADPTSGTIMFDVEIPLTYIQDIEIVSMDLTPLTNISPSLYQIRGWNGSYTPNFNSKSAMHNRKGRNQNYSWDTKDFFATTAINGQVSRLRFTFTHNTGQAAAAEYELTNLIAQAKGIPSVAFTFDDVRATTYTKAFPYLTSKGLRGTVAVSTDNVRANNDSGNLTLAQLQEMYAAGWDIVVNNTVDELPITSKASLSAAIQEAIDGRDYLIANGMPRSASHIILSNGEYTSPVSLTNKADMQTTSGSNTATVDETGLAVGMDVYHPNVPSGTTITAIGTGTITMSANATGTTSVTTKATFASVPDQFTYPAYPDGLLQNGFLSARATFSTYDILSLGIADPMSMCGRGFTGQNLNAILPFVDEVIELGAHQSYYLHNIDDDPVGWTATTNNVSINVYESFFRGLVDRVVERINAGQLRHYTLSEVYVNNYSNKNRLAQLAVI